ncbi:MAG TPA: 1-(5-phosphoribosyl)-5-[(5-phosphoribosylamino)methylideneamino] imidazole-4-carboxamide isomerase [Gemmatimonadaceae bacterium]|nr:1-(5-phosphoribosyl)-5-[(5-phosphoribosylamino)methylideneamino] imidazole-4-carboxamide isomerase [Gemmatimonadaceae bacterium]
MIVIPAVDLRAGACVQLVGGSYDDERVRLGDPGAVARGWEELGFHHLHLVDLDAATGRGSNVGLVREILTMSDAQIQVGGGVREFDRIEELLSDGARRVIVGTRALEDAVWLDEMTSRFPDELVVAVDVFDRRVVTRGWSRSLPVDVLDAIDELNALPLAGFLVTAVHREGQLRGTDLPLMEDVAEAAAFPVYAAGGIATLADVRALADRGVAAAIVGMALYTGAIDPRAAASEFGE